MTGKNCLAALFATSAEVEEALQKLERAGFDLDAAVSVLGRLYEADTGAGGESGRQGDEKRTRQPHQRYCRKFEDFALFPNTTIGRVAVCGPMMGAMLDTLRSDEADGVLAALESALAAAGVPEHSMRGYEDAIARGHILILVKGSAREVEQGVELLATGSEIEVAVHVRQGTGAAQGIRAGMRGQEPLATG
ncbi:MAG TPA: hypothetical protein ENK27_13815 [Desulfobulbus sp.]|nr:hypothetical protein [Desulfobulbus sp.]